MVSRMERWQAGRARLGGRGVAERVTIEVEDGTIAGAVRNDDTRADLHVRGIVVPGFVPAHTHAPHRGRGIAVFDEMLTAAMTTVGGFHYVDHNDGGGSCGLLMQWETCSPKQQRRSASESH